MAAAEVVAILLSENEAARVLGISARKFAELRSEPWLPAPLRLGPRLLRWSRTELEASVAHMPRLEQTQAEPTALAKARAARSRTEVR